MAVSVVEGLDGWLFCEANGPNRPLDQARDLSGWKRSVLPQSVANMIARHRRMRARGIPFIVLLVPECSSIYPEYLPSGRTVELPGAAEILCAWLKRSGLDAICPSETLRAAKSRFEVFLRHDTHWTARAAHLCYKDIMAVIGRHLPVPPLDDDALRFGIRRGFGDLGIRLRPERLGDIQTVEIPGHPVEVRANVNDQLVRSYRHTASVHGAHRLLLFRDSSANALLPFLERTFAETISIAPSPQLLDDAIDRFQPDVVMMCVSETGLASTEFPFVDWDQRTFEQIYLSLAEDGAATDLRADALEQLEGGSDNSALAAAATAAIVSPDKLNITNLAWAMLNGEEYEYCRTIARSFADANADRFLHYLHSSAASHLGDFNEATEALTKALALQPCNAQYLYSAGELNFQEGRYPEALAAIERSIEFAPLYERSWVIAITCLRRMDNSEAARIRQHQADDIFGVGQVSPEP